MLLLFTRTLKYIKNPPYVVVDIATYYFPCSIRYVKINDNDPELSPWMFIIKRTMMMDGSLLKYIKISFVPSVEKIAILQTPFALQYAHPFTAQLCWIALASTTNKNYDAFSKYLVRSHHWSRIKKQIYKIYRMIVLMRTVYLRRAIIMPCVKDTTYYSNLQYTSFENRVLCSHCIFGRIVGLPWNMQMYIMLCCTQ